MGSQVLKFSVLGVVLMAVLVLPFATAFAADDWQVPSVMNFAKVSPTLWRGAAPSEEAMRQLASKGVNTVIDLRLPGAAADRESGLANQLGLNYFHIPLGYFTTSADKIDSFLKIVTNPKYQPVFVHCRQGADRTGAMVAIYRMLVDGWPLDRAYDEMREHHFKPWLISLRRTVGDWSPASGSKLAHNYRPSL